MYQQFEGSFESIGTTLPMRGLGEKMGPENHNLKQRDRAQLFISFDLSRRASNFNIFVCQNWMKNGQVMSMRSACSQVALAYFGPKILATFC